MYEALQVCHQPQGQLKDKQIISLALSSSHL